MAEHYPLFVETVEASCGHLPAFVRQEFEDYLKCGLLEHGFLRVKCDGCLNGTLRISPYLLRGPVEELEPSTSRKMTSPLRDLKGMLSPRSDY